MDANPLTVGDSGKLDDVQELGLGTRWLTRRERSVERLDGPSDPGDVGLKCLWDLSRWKTLLRSDPYLVVEQVRMGGIAVAWIAKIGG